MLNMYVKNKISETRPSYHWEEEEEKKTRNTYKKFIEKYKKYKKIKRENFVYCRLL